MHFKLNVHPASSFNDVPDVPCGSKYPHVVLMVLAGSDGSLADNFRVAMVGRQPIKATFPAASVWAIAELCGFTFCIELSPEDISLPLNSLATPWRDLKALVQSRHGTASPGLHARDASYLHTLEDLGHSSETGYVAVRWAIVVEDDLTLSVGLPTSAATLEGKPVLRSDTSATGYGA